MEIIGGLLILAVIAGVILLIRHLSKNDTSSGTGSGGGRSRSDRPRNRDY